MRTASLEAASSPPLAVSSPPPSCGAGPAPGGPCCAALRLALGHAGGAARVALGPRVSPQGEGSPPAGTLGGALPGWWREKGFYSSYPLVMPPFTTV